MRCVEWLGTSPASSVQRRRLVSEVFTSGARKVALGNQMVAEGYFYGVGQLPLLPFGLGAEAPAPEPAAVPPMATGSSPVTR